MSSELAGLANTIVSAAYVAITLAILGPLVRVRQVGTNRLGTATAAIFFSCAVGHAFHAVHGLASGHDTVTAYEAGWDLVTACVAVYYWTLRRVYGSLMEGATLFEDLEQRSRLTELEHHLQLASATAQAERERDAHAAMLKAVISHSQSLVYVRDLEGRYLLANRAFELAVGVGEHELLGVRREFLQPALTTGAGGEQVEGEQWLVGPDGRQTYETVVFPLYDPDGRAYGSCGIALDVTARRRADEATAAARDAALASAAAKSTFLATMSHEIRTPMNAVIGMTGLLLDTELDERQRDYLETVRTSGDALLDVINDILDFSKIEAGELRLERQSFDLRTCAEGSMDLVAQAAAVKGLDLVLQMDPDCLSRVVGDASRLRQVLVNLLSNAVKFTERGEVLLTVTTELLDDEVLVTCRVTDTGIGIAARDLDRLFTSFSQVDSSTTRAHGGTGLGLVISRRLVEAMAGELVVESEPGTGSSFLATVRLGAAAPVGPALDPARLAGLRVLVVDDNASTRHALQVQLADWGMGTSTAEGALQALQLVHELPRFDVALVDRDMPGMDGPQLATALRALPHGADLPLVLLDPLGASSTPGTASDFEVTVTKPARRAPLYAALMQAGARSAVPVGEAPRPATSGAAHPLRVLVAEDNLVNQKVVVLMLTALGHLVDVVGDGCEAVAAVQAATYDLVLMDVHMPRTDGLEATRAIREGLPDHRQPLIVALTASVLLEDREACARAGMDRHLAKPVRQEQLAALLDGVRSGGAPEGALDRTVLDALVESVGGGAQTRDGLLRTYLADAARQLAALRAAAAGADHDSARAVAHSLQSSSAVLGLTDLAAVLHQVEQTARRREDLRELSGRAGAAFDRAVGAVGDLLDDACRAGS